MLMKGCPVTCCNSPNSTASSSMSRKRRKPRGRFSRMRSMSRRALKRDPEYGDLLCGHSRGAVREEDPEMEAKEVFRVHLEGEYLFCLRRSTRSRLIDVLGIVMNPHAIMATSPLVWRQRPTPHRQNCGQQRVGPIIRFTMSPSCCWRRCVSKLRRDGEANGSGQRGLVVTAAMIKLQGLDAGVGRTSHTAMVQQITTWMMNAAEDQRTVQKFAARAKQAIKKLDDSEADSARFMDARIKIRNWAGSADRTGRASR